MEPVKLAILGAGDLRVSPGIIGSLATYYGERPLDLRFYDADEERLDLFDRLARVVFGEEVNEFPMRATTDLGEALEDAMLVVLGIGTNCARLQLRQEGLAVPADDAEALRVAVDRAARQISDAANVLSLLDRSVPVPLPSFYRLDWPPALTPAECQALPFQILRWLHREEPVYDLVSAHERSPFKRWLDDPESAETVFGTRVLD